MQSSLCRGGQEGVVRHGNVLVSIPYLGLVIPSHLATRSSWSTPSAPLSSTSAQRHEILSDGRKQSYSFFLRLARHFPKQLSQTTVGSSTKRSKDANPGSSYPSNITMLLDHGTALVAPLGVGHSFPLPGLLQLCKRLLLSVHLLIEQYQQQQSFGDGFVAVHIRFCTPLRQAPC